MKRWKTEGKQRTISHRGTGGDLFKNLQVARGDTNRVSGLWGFQGKGLSRKGQEAQRPCHNHPWPKRSNTAHVTVTTGEWSGCVLSSARRAWKARLSCAEGVWGRISGKLKLGTLGGKVSWNMLINTNYYVTEFKDHQGQWFGGFTTA